MGEATTPTTAPRQRLQRPCLGAVYFATMEHPRAAWLRRLMRLAGCEFGHVAIADTLCVLDPSGQGDRYTIRPTFEACYPTLEWSIAVPVFWMEWEDFDSRPRRMWPTALRWLTMGLWPTRDCVQVVARILRRSNVRVPWWITTPDQLFDHLRREGYELREVTRPDGATRARQGHAVACGQGPGIPVPPADG